MRKVKIGIVGDYNPKNKYHPPTTASLVHSANLIGAEIDPVWIPSESLDSAEGLKQLSGFDALYCGPGSPYRSMDGALASIRFARENDVPFVGTWGGFQHALVEYARNVIGIRNAEHEESSPDAEALVVTRLSCSLAGMLETVNLTPGTLAYQCYSKSHSEEQFACNYGFNPLYRDKVIRGPLIVSGVDQEGAVRVVEIPGLRFFIATLFVPQMLSTPESPHPLITAYMKAAMEYSAARI